MTNSLHKNEADSLSETRKTQYLVRLSEIFFEDKKEIFEASGIGAPTHLGGDLFLVSCNLPESRSTNLQELHFALLRWVSPVHHHWPCNPLKIKGFVEKTCHAMFEKFAPLNPQTILACGAEPSGRGHLQALILHLQGELNATWSKNNRSFCNADSQIPDKPTLFIFVTFCGVFASLASPQFCKFPYPSGAKFFGRRSDRHNKKPNELETADKPTSAKQSEELLAPSRAGAKALGALTLLNLCHNLPPQGGTWLELGASPGGMTSELVGNGYHVIAVDRAPLAAEISSNPFVSFALQDVSSFKLKKTVDALLCDMNCNSTISWKNCLRLAKHLKPSAPFVFTFKFDKKTWREALNLLPSMLAEASLHNIHLQVVTHLFHNRKEITLVFRKS